jgi:hypothetical protein
MSDEPESISWERNARQHGKFASFKTACNGLFGYCLALPGFRHLIDLDASATNGKTVGEGSPAVF